MAITYNSLGSRVTINVAGTTVTAGFTSAVAVVGGYDADNADPSVTPGDVETVSGPSDARTLFGDNCELTRQIELLGTPSTIYAVPVQETESTESFSSTTSGTLANTPQDPSVHPDESITVTDTSAGTDLTVEYVYEDGSPSQPTDEDTAVIDIPSGQWAVDASSSYDITYTHGDYEGAIDAAVTQPVRYVWVCTEDDGLKGYLTTQLQNEADNGSYKRGIAGARVGIDSGSIESYQPTNESFRLVEVAPARATSFSGSVRTGGAVTNLLAAQPIDSGGSITYDSVTGLESLNTSYTPNEAKTFEQVTALTRTMDVAQGVTTSADKPIRDIYKAEIVDTVMESFFGTMKSFAGGPNTDNSQRKLRGALRRVANSFASTRPPALATGEGTRPYDIQVGLGATDEEIAVTAGIEPASIAKMITLDLNVGEVNTVNVEA